MDFHGFDLKILFHEEAISRMPDAFSEGRNLREGYIRGAGVQFGNFYNLLNSDRVLAEANTFSKNQAGALTDEKLGNLYLLIRYFLPKLGKGCIAEFGVNKGGSALFMARVAKEYMPGTKIYCFDSFAGMPEASANDLHQKGDFDDSEMYLVDAAKRYGLNNIVIAKGMFCDTVKHQAPKIAPILLAHFDGDLYQSTVDCYEGTLGSMAPQGYLVFDDAFASSCTGAFDAVAEYPIRRDGRKPEQIWPHIVFRS